MGLQVVWGIKIINITGPDYSNRFYFPGRDTVHKAYKRRRLAVWSIRAKDSNIFNAVRWHAVRKNTGYGSIPLRYEKSGANYDILARVRIMTQAGHIISEVNGVVKKLAEIHPHGVAGPHTDDRWGFKR